MFAVGALLAGAAAPSMAQEGFSEDLGVVRARAGDVWRLCSDVKRHETIQVASAIEAGTASSWPRATTESAAALSPRALLFAISYSARATLRELKCL